MLNMNRNYNAGNYNNDISSGMDSSESDVTDVADVTSESSEKMNHKTVNVNRRGLIVKNAVARLTENVVKDTSNEDTDDPVRVQASANEVAHEA